MRAIIWKMMSRMMGSALTSSGPAASTSSDVDAQRHVSEGEGRARRGAMELRRDVLGA